jgi:hypothetical protein
MSSGMAVKFIVWMPRSSAFSSTRGADNAAPQEYNILKFLKLTVRVLASCMFLSIAATSFAQNAATPAPFPGGSILSGGSAAGTTTSVVSATISPRVMAVLQAAKDAGRNMHAYAKVGDSITASQRFMIGFNKHEYDLGENAYLEETIAYFEGAHWRESIAAQPGFNAASLLDPLQADDPQCEPNETPLACEYRVYNPAIAIIMLGAVDVNPSTQYDIASYETFMTQIIEYSLEQNVVPVLTTFPFALDYYPDKSIAYNALIRELAQRYEIPLIDLQTPAAGLPHGGVQEDGFHLTTRGDDMIDIHNGDQHRYGIILRNLLTLQLLDTMRHAMPQ